MTRPGLGANDEHNAEPLSELAEAMLASAPPASIPVPLNAVFSPVVRALARRRNKGAIADALRRNRVSVRNTDHEGSDVTELISRDHPRTEDDDYLVYVHGGAFVVGEPVDSISIGLTASTGLTCFSLHYGLAPGTRFPSSLHQIEKAWDAVTSGRSGRPVLVATSAGANLALGVLQQLLLRDDAAAPLPAAVVLFSPAADLHEFDSARLVNEGLDPVVKWHGMLDKALPAYLDGHDPDDPRASPIMGDFTGLTVPTLLVTAGRDLLRPDVLSLARRLEHQGVPIEVDDAAGLWHAYQQVPTPETAASLERVRRFVSTHLSA
ncbi:alpha/beta hydrolase fold domain-containing protein [Rhodococcus sp. 06-235-1A]|uniref:alpha/beta hydrolase fold domain-containing protein n=1 Tax=Rhodococcus sp. 06-235-1A TaxID=2022508 RepID=UPI0015C6467F|nr:alpha/beta hydrolase fold domain-containing protein [Rhodococcus sp. 06-235-1A]